MKIIFLDIDGILLHEEFYRRNPTETIADHCDGLYKLDPYAMDNLNHIIDKTDCKIVISSSWRCSWRIDELQKLFKHNGFKGEIIDLTPIYLKSYTHEISKGEEIYDWLDKNPVENYCIIDDCNDMLPEQEDNFVWVDDKVGLTEMDAERVIEILNEK